MNKNRILSLILSVVMMVTIVFSTGVFAEETEVPNVESAPEEIVANAEAEVVAAEETAAQETEEAEEQPADFEEEDDPMPADAAAEDETEAEEEPLFERGYVRANNGASVYP